MKTDRHITEYTCDHCGVTCQVPSLCLVSRFTQTFPQEWCLVYRANQVEAHLCSSACMSAYRSEEDGGDG
jgi:hypothetical protein